MVKTHIDEIRQLFVEYNSQGFVAPVTIIDNSLEMTFDETYLAKHGLVVPNSASVFIKIKYAVIAPAIPSVNNSNYDITKFGKMGDILAGAWQNFNRAKLGCDLTKPTFSFKLIPSIYDKLSGLRGVYKIVKFGFYFESPMNTP